MVNFFKQLKARNSVLYWFGWLCLLAAAICAVMIQYSNNIVLGINAWIKPTKFFLSTVIFSWTMGWYLHYLNSRRKVISYTWMTVLVFTFELYAITWQAANGRLSHFNISTPTYALLFAAMGIGILIFTFWTIYICYLFFRQKNYTVPMHYIWGIRLGLILFIFFSFEGGIMSQQLRHTMGSPDGGPGLPFVNWSTAFGDLRVAHFFGIHSLQILPLAAYYLAKNKAQVFLFSALYLTFVIVLLMQALYRIPLIG